MISCIVTDSSSVGPLPLAGDRHGSQLDTESSNGPSTFEEACDVLGLSHEETQQLALGCSLPPSPSQLLSPMARPMPHVRCSVPHSDSQRISGDIEHHSDPPHRVVPSTSLWPCHSPSLPIASTASPQLPPSPDPRVVPDREQIPNEAIAPPPGHAEPPNGVDESTLMALTNYRDGKFRCSALVEGKCCGYENKKKIRMLSHISDKHFDQRPWHCRGQCGKDAW